MMALPPFNITPPLLNSANPWASSYEDLKALYECPLTGAVTIRTSLWENGFAQNPEHHQYTFFEAGKASTGSKGKDDMNGGGTDAKGRGGVGETSSLNTLGYSPIAFQEYMSMLNRLRMETTEAKQTWHHQRAWQEKSKTTSTGAETHGVATERTTRKHEMAWQEKSMMVATDVEAQAVAAEWSRKREGENDDAGGGQSWSEKSNTVATDTAESQVLAVEVEVSQGQVQETKPFIVSVTGTANEVGKCANFMLDMMQDEPELELMMEINLSCPNIPDKAPPAYDGTSLCDYIDEVSKVKRLHAGKKGLHVGIKTPPYTYHGQFVTLLSSLEKSAKLEAGCPVSFITATNTLGSCLVLSEAGDQPALGSVNASGIGGMAGDALHPLALGNVKTIRQLLDASSFEDVRRIQVIGIGGVKDAEGWRRMRRVGAGAVGVGTALGREGLSVFAKISERLKEGELA